MRILDLSFKLRYGNIDIHQSTTQYNTTSSSIRYYYITWKFYMMCCNNTGWQLWYKTPVYILQTGYKICFLASSGKWHFCMEFLPCVPHQSPKSTQYDGCDWSYHYPTHFTDGMMSATTIFLHKVRNGTRYHWQTPHTWQTTPTSSPAVRIWYPHPT